MGCVSGTQAPSAELLNGRPSKPTARALQGGGLEAQGGVQKPEALEEVRLDGGRDVDRSGV